MIGLTLIVLGLAAVTVICLLADALRDVRNEAAGLVDACQQIQQTVADLPDIQLTAEQERIVAEFVDQLAAEPTAGGDR